MLAVGLLTGAIGYDIPRWPTAEEEGFNVSDSASDDNIADVEGDVCNEQRRAYLNQALWELEHPRLFVEPTYRGETTHIHYEQYAALTGDSRFRHDLHMSKDEMANVFAVLVPAISAHPRSPFSGCDRVWLILHLLATGKDLLSIAEKANCSASTVCIMIQEDLESLAIAATAAWIPGPASQADRCVFPDFPTCVCAVDSTPIKFNDKWVASNCTAHAFYSQKYGHTCAKVQLAVAPNAICVDVAVLRPGRVNDVRILHESGLGARFQYLTLVNGQYRWARYGRRSCSLGERHAKRHAASDAAARAGPSRAAAAARRRTAAPRPEGMMCVIKVVAIRLFALQ
jgi:hypothetical protein